MSSEQNADNGLGLSEDENASADVVIAGGGQVGLALAVALKSAAPDLDVTLVDMGDPRTDRRASRASTIAAGGRQLLEQLGVWPEVAEEAQPVHAMIVTDSRTSDVVRPVFLNLDPRAGGDSAGAHVVADGVVVTALAHRTDEVGVDLVTGDGVADFETGRSQIVCRTRNGRTIAARLLVAADGARSRLRELAGISTIGWSYGQSGIVATIRHERPHEGRAEEHFLPGGPFAILPLKGNCSSLVWTEPTEVADRLVRSGGIVLDAELKRRIGRRLGEVELLDTPRAFPLRLMLARSFIAPRLALAGDAAHGIHPIAGQGLNMGYRDVAALAETIVETHRLGLDIGDLTALESYDRWRRFDTVEMGLMTDALTRLFSNDNPVLRLARDVGLGLVERMPALKRMFEAEARGDTKSAPRLLRGEPI